MKKLELITEVKENAILSIKGIKNVVSVIRNKKIITSEPKVLASIRDVVREYYIQDIVELEEGVRIVLNDNASASIIDENELVIYINSTNTYIKELN